MRIDVISLFPELFDAVSAPVLAPARWTMGFGSCSAGIRGTLPVTTTIASMTDPTEAGPAW